MGAPDESKHDDAPIGFGGAKKVEEGEGPWLVSYADLMTLLMGFFALMLSMASLEKKEFEKVKASAAEAFGGEYKNPYEDLAQNLSEFIKQHQLEDQVQIKVSFEGVELTFRGTLFFDSGQFAVKSEAQALMLKLADAIKGQTTAFDVLIEGHTDHIPISQGVIASNWELSALRSSRIAQLFEQKGFKRDQILIIGWGDTRPLVPNTTVSGEPIAENMAKNRRVVLRVFNRKLSRPPIDNPPESSHGTKAGDQQSATLPSTSN